MRHHVSRVLTYTPDQLFRLVGDVAAYPDFVPWITSMRVDDATQVSDGVSRLRADATVGFSFLKERFGTAVLRDANQRKITVDLLSGPFRRLHNEWRFEPHPAGCEVVFDIDFEFKAKLLDMLLKANFGLAVDRLIACFEARARTLYGASALQTVAASPASPTAG
ncbi:MAG: type II toxin-antitoxin system RatA family toxin [Caulobacteraceae bacterium]